MPRLHVASDDAWDAAFGVLPEYVADDPDELIRACCVPVSDDEDVLITWDEILFSVRVRHRRRGILVTDLFRDLATLLTIIEGPTNEIVIEYGSSEMSGRARIQFESGVRIEDVILRC